MAREAMRCGARWANLRVWRLILPFLLAVILGVGCAPRPTPITCYPPASHSA